jgi:Zn-dependent protease with chaperone function/pimeloyl-ACP methyl ester carboxylesterase
MIRPLGMTLLLLGLATPAVSQPAQPFARPGPPLAVAELTPAVRQRADRLALDTPPERARERGVDVAGDLSAWLIKNVTLTDEEELAAAALVHEEVLKKAGDKARVAPRAAQRVFDRLVKELPPHLKPKAFRYTLTVLDSPIVHAGTCGGGHVYVTQGLLGIFKGKGRGEAALAFALAHELGHGALGHCRRGYQLLALEKELQRGIAMGVDGAKLRAVLETTVVPGGKLIAFLYSREQHHRADLFALHLCRNAGVDPDAALDALRWLVAAQHASVLIGEAEGRVIQLLTNYLGTHPDPARRLKRLLLEQRGAVEDEKRFGLFAYDRQTGGLARCEDGALREGARCVVFVHGLHGDEDSFEEFLEFVAKRREAKGVELLVFRYPGNGSIVHAGRYLRNEMARVVRDPKRASFVCHSAGGLVFRYHAEKEGGAFDRAVMLGTPHGGSRMTGLKFLLDAVDFVEDLPLGLPGAVTATVRDGRGSMSPDLCPDSLFLRHLGYDARLARRYHVVSGRYLGRKRAALLVVSFEAGKVALKYAIRKEVDSPFLREMGLRRVDRLDLTDEVLNGDLVVSADSARLKGAGKVTATKRHHRDLKDEEDVMREVVAYLFPAR